MIFEILGTGSEAARTGREICEALQITARDLTTQIERERRQGLPICASCGKSPGYYKPGTRAEMEAYCRSLQHREREIAKTRRACAKTLQKLPECGEGIVI